MTPLKLTKTYTVGSETFDRLEFRAPGFADYRKIGPVYDVQRGIVIPDRVAIFAYADALVTKPAAGALQVLALEDAMAVEDHIVDFFVKARASLAARTSSSSGSDGAPATSTD